MQERGDLCYGSGDFSTSQTQWKIKLSLFSLHAKKSHIHYPRNRMKIKKNIYVYKSEQHTVK